MAEAPNHALIRLLPDRISVMRAEVRVHAPRGIGSDLARASLLHMLEVAQFFANLLAMLTPLPSHAGRPTRERRPPQQIHALIGAGAGAADEPLVPRRTGHDPRLPAGRHHP